MKPGRITACAVAAAVATGSMTAPAVDAAPVQHIDDVITSSLERLPLPIVAALMVSSMLLPGCHMMNTVACKDPNA